MQPRRKPHDENGLEPRARATSPRCSRCVERHQDAAGSLDDERPVERVDPRDKVAGVGVAPCASAADHGSAAIEKRASSTMRHAGERGGAPASPSSFGATPVCTILTIAGCLRARRSASAREAATRVFPTSVSVPVTK